MRLGNLKNEKYRHVFLLVFWPVFGIVFMLFEKYYPRVWRAITGDVIVYEEVECFLDAYVPFCEWFVIPYYFWFALLFVMVIYTLIFDIRAFRQFMWFVILSYSITTVIYMIWPNMQGLRPNSFTRDNWMIDIVKRLYTFDTNTNVCPSIHVLGSFAACFAGMHSHTLKGRGWKTFFVISTLLISLSTIFLRQHSVLDVIAALALCAVLYPLVFYVICPCDRAIKIRERRSAARES